MSESAPTPPPQKSNVWILSGIGIVAAAVLGLGIWATVYEGETPKPKLAVSTPPPSSPSPPPKAKFKMSIGDSAITLNELPAKKTLSLQSISSWDVQDAKAATHFRLLIPIKAPQGTPIDLHDLVIHVLFYDQLDGKEIVETAANVNTHWAKPPVNWSDSDTEELIVDYELPKAPVGNSPQPERKYYGYVIRVYYRQELQAALAEPEQLAQQYPASPTLAEDSLRISTRRPAALPPPPPEPVDLSEALPDIAAGSSMGLLSVTRDEVKDTKALQHFTLHIPIKARPKLKVDVKEVMLQVLFYDLRDGSAVTQTCANVKSTWDSPPADWTHSDVENLNVDYQLLRPENRTMALNENRQFYGYIVRLYYRKRLQTAVAQPELLAQKFPPPPILQESDPPAQ